MNAHNDFIEKYFNFCEKVKREEDHENILILANYRFQQEIANDESLSRHLKLSENSRGEFSNVLFDHQIVFTPDVESFELVNCGYENDIQRALKPYLDKETDRVRQEYLKNLAR